MLLIYTSLYFLGTMFYYLGYNIIASGVIIALAIFLYIKDYLKTKRVVNVRGLFGLSFIGGFGLSLLKLSNLSDKYSIMTFITVFVSYFSLYLGTYFAEKKDCKCLDGKNAVSNKKKFLKSNFSFPILLMCITFFSFLIEACMLGFVPLLTKDTPHAYSTFHIFGLHYITTLYAFIPSFAACDYFLLNDKKKSIKLIIISFIYVIVMSTLLISRSQLILSVCLFLFTIIINKNDVIIDIKNKKTRFQNSKKIFGIVFVSLVLFIGLYIVITISRAHDTTYLNSIFDMKNKKMPIFITQPYMYVAHNFENLNFMINNTFRWTFGRRMLYPFFTLTLIKKFFPIVVDAPIYLIKEELSTKTLVYDFYYDFGLVGIIVFCFIIGYIGKLLEEMVYRKLSNNSFKNNNYIVILFSLYSYYMFFSFFQTYFSLTDTWVHIIFLFIVILFIKNKKVAL